jgi:phenylpropionate dioxygenase-like ring-hydroxylating dioxygenase large terminal subunit
MGVLMFLKNYWYVAAWSHEIECRPLGRILLNQPVVFFRGSDGTVAALEDRCPHRGYPLHRGRVVEEVIECGYHGLTFDGSGQCTKVPGQAQIPPGANIPSYPVVERWGFVWIWMGDPSLSDSNPMVDWPLLGDPAWQIRGERLHVKCDYKLIIDNLLDLSHLTYVHPHTLGSAAKLDQVKISNEITENSVVNSRWLIDIKPPPTYARGGFGGNVDRWQITTFRPPAFLNLYAGAAPTGGGAPEGNFAGAIGLHTFNAMTPETANTTHYYWALAQECASTDSQLSGDIFHDIQKTVQEDVAVFEAQQRSLDLRPDAPMVTIKSDAAPIAARRIIERLLKIEGTKSIPKTLLNYT